MIAINKEKTSQRKNEESDEKNDIYKKIIKKNVTTKKIEIKNGRNERLKENKSIYKTNVITKKINSRESSYSKVKKEDLQKFEISQNQNMKVNPEQKLGNQFPKIITTRQFQNKDYSSNLESIIKPYDENNTLTDKKINSFNKDNHSINFSQSLIFNRKENIITSSGMSHINSNKIIIKSKSPSIRKPYFDENSSNSQQFIVLNEDNDSVDIKQNNNSIKIINKNSIEKNLNQSQKKENFSETLMDKNYIENKIDVHKRYESNKEREFIARLKKKNIEKVWWSKIETDEMKNKNKLNGQSKYNYEYFFSNEENKYGDSGLV
jgi:hypothetical protein